MANGTRLCAPDGIDIPFSEKIVLNDANTAEFRAIRQIGLDRVRSRGAVLCKVMWRNLAPVGDHGVWEIGAYVFS